MSTIEDELRADLDLSTAALERLRRKMESLAKEAAVYREYYLADVAQTAAEVAHDRAARESAGSAPDELIDANLAANERFIKAREAVDRHRMAAELVPRPRRHVIVDRGATPKEPAGIFDVIEAQFGRSAREDAERQARALVEQQNITTWAEAAVARMKERDEARAQAANPLPGVRTVVLRFAIEMERTLRANDFKGGWEDEDPDDLLASLEDEVKELGRAVSSGVVAANDCVRAEAVDVANFAMMLADRSGRMGEELPADLQAALDVVRNRKGT